MDAEKFWDNTAERYSKSPVRDEALYQEKLKKTQKYLTQESKVLEIGCGTGTTALHHAPFAGEILATDISANMVEIARKKASEAGIENVRFQQATVEDFQGEPNSYDVILALNIIHLLEDPAAAIKKMYGLLKPGGYFVTGTVCLGDVLFSPWRIAIPVMRLLNKIPPVRYLKRVQLMTYIADAGFEIDYEKPAKRGEAAFVILKKP